MTYKNAREVLPPELLKEVQRYLCGEIIYIPKEIEQKACWGQISGLREQVTLRNSDICQMYRQGIGIHSLMDAFCLSEASIRKIIYASKQAAEAVNE